MGSRQITPVEQQRTRDDRHDNSKRDLRDRNRVSADEEYEVRHFAEQNRITPEQVVALIAKVGNDRAKLTEAAKQLRDNAS
jgi:hypothetical protein